MYGRKAGGFNMIWNIDVNKITLIILMDYNAQWFNVEMSVIEKKSWNSSRCFHLNFLCTNCFLQEIISFEKIVLLRAYFIAVGKNTCPIKKLGSIPPGSFMGNLWLAVPGVGDSTQLPARVWNNTRHILHESWKSVLNTKLKSKSVSQSINELITLIVEMYCLTYKYTFFKKNILQLHMGLEIA